MSALAPGPAAPMGAHEPPFEEQVKRISPCDLLLVEGFKFAPIPKLEVWRAATGELDLHGRP